MTPPAESRVVAQFPPRPTRTPPANDTTGLKPVVSYDVWRGGEVEVEGPRG